MKNFNYILISLILVSCQDTADQNPWNGIVTSDDEKTQIVQNLAKAYTEGNFDAANEYFTEDGKHFFNTIEYTTQEIIDGYNFHSVLWDSIQHIDPAVLTVTFNNGTTYTNQWADWSGISRTTGEKAESTFHCCWQWENDKIISTKCYIDSPLITNEVAIYEAANN